jgi:hypothetical protein
VERLGDPSPADPDVAVNIGTLGQVGTEGHRGEASAALKCGSPAQPWDQVGPHRSAAGIKPARIEAWLTGKAAAAIGAVEGICTPSKRGACTESMASGRASGVEGDQPITCDERRPGG